MAGEARAAFGGLDARRLNWRPDATQWSVAQCFEHLLIANRLMLGAADATLDNTRPRVTSPFISVVTYSVLDGWRLMLAHDRRHFEQARRVTRSPGFPARQE